MRKLSCTRLVAESLTDLARGTSQVTEAWISGIERGSYILPFVQAPTNLMVQAQSGLLSPGLMWWPLEVVAAPFYVLFRRLLRAVVSHNCPVAFLP